MDSLGDIKDTAAQWLARRGAEDWSAADEAELAQWLSASTGHLIEFLRMQAAWQEADRLKVLGAGIDRGTVPGLDEFRSSPFFKGIPTESRASAAPRRATPSIAVRVTAAIVVVVAIGLGLFAWNVPRPALYSTPIGVTAAVPLADGSKVTLNTDSEIRVAVTPTERHVALEHGEAFFEVVRDAARPFVVSAGDQRVVVVGTKFSVRRDGDDVRVVVMEGKVRVERDEAGAAPEIAPLIAGSVARVSEGSVAVQERTMGQTQELLSWRSGYIVFHEASLADAAAEFNRYNTLKIVIGDAAVADVSVSGNFRSTNVESFVRLLEEGFPVTVQRQDERIVLTHKRHTAE
jgi:transmembrane sensor